MDILIIIDNISQNYKWCHTFNAIKRWIIYWLNNSLIQKNLKSVTIGKTFPKPKLIKLDNDNLKIEKIIDFFDSIIIKKTQSYDCINIKNIFDMCSKNTFNKELFYKGGIIENEIECKYSDIYVFCSILQSILTDNNVTYIKKSLINDKIKDIKFTNFSYRKCLPNEPKILETVINQRYIDNYDLYVEISTLLNLKPTKNNFNSLNNSSINDTLEKLFEIEFENYKKSYLINKDIVTIYFNYIEELNKNHKFENITESCTNFIKYCINLVRIILLEKFNNINFNIPQGIFNSNLPTDYVLEIIKFYNLVYPKILANHLETHNKKPSFSLRKINQLNFSDITLKNYPNDDSTNYLYSNTTMTNWKQEYDNLNPFGIALKYIPHYLSYKGMYERELIRTYPNMMISSISNNWLSLFDYYQLVLGDIDTGTKTKFNINEYVFIDNLHGETNIMLPLYINYDHWKIAKIYWSYHMTFINEAFEFDYVKRMDNIYFLTIIKTINIISNTKCNQNIIRLFVYILRTGIQICIDNKYSCNNKSDYNKYFNLLLNSENLQSFNKFFIDYLIRVIQSILTSTIQLQELTGNINKLVEIYIKHLINFEYNKEAFDIINAMNNEEKLGVVEQLEEKINLDILAFSELNKDLEFFCKFMNKIYSIKKFNQLIKFLDKNNGCLPIGESELNCEIIYTIINSLVIENISKPSLDIEKLIKNTGLIDYI
jgi:hypothetical protein